MHGWNLRREQEDAGPGRRSGIRRLDSLVGQRSWVARPRPPPRPPRPPLRTAARQTRTERWSVRCRAAGVSRERQRQRGDPPHPLRLRPRRPAGAGIVWVSCMLRCACMGAMHGHCQSMFDVAMRLLTPSSPLKSSSSSSSSSSSPSRSAGSRCRFYRSHKGRHRRRLTEAIAFQIVQVFELVQHP